MKRGFSIIELMVVLALLAAIVFGVSFCVNQCNQPSPAPTKTDVLFYAMSVDEKCEPSITSSSTSGAQIKAVVKLDCGKITKTIGVTCIKSNDNVRCTTQTPTAKGR